MKTSVRAKPAFLFGIAAASLNALTLLAAPPDCYFSPFVGLFTPRTAEAQSTSVEDTEAESAPLTAPRGTEPKAESEVIKAPTGKLPEAKSEVLSGPPEAEDQKAEAEVLKAPPAEERKPSSEVFTAPRESEPKASSPIIKSPEDVNGESDAKGEAKGEVISENGKTPPAPLPSEPGGVITAPSGEPPKPAGSEILSAPPEKPKLDEAITAPGQLLPDPEEQAKTPIISGPKADAAVKPTSSQLIRRVEDVAGAR